VFLIEIVFRIHDQGLGFNGTWGDQQRGKCMMMELGSLYVLDQSRQWSFFFFLILRFAKKGIQTLFLYYYLRL